MSETEKRDTYFVGDIHGEFRTLIWKATEQYKLKDVDLIVLGDFGVGFDGTLKKDYQRASEKMEKYGIQVYTIRGNHDDPAYFEEDKQEELKELYPRITFIPDHKIFEVNGKTIYPIGGGGSTDIIHRTPGKSWWEGEYIKEIPIKDLPGKVDIIISHEAPLSFEPILTRFPETPEEQFLKIQEGRQYLDKVLREVTCSEWYYGHYHNYYSGSYGDVMYRGLGILEFYMRYGDQC